MQIVSVINYKGGVGKTSLTANVAAELAYRGYDVLALDLDAQASLTFSFVTPDVWSEEYAEGRTIKSWFDSFESGEAIALESLVFTPRKTSGRLFGHGRLDLISSHLGLINVDLELATELSASSLRLGKKKFISIHRRLAEGITEDLRARYDIMLIDCPPNFNIVTKTAIVASDHLLVPARPDYLSTLGIDYLVRSVRELVNDYNDYATFADADIDTIGPDIIGVVFTMIQEYSGEPIAAQRAFIMRVKQLGVVNVFEHYIKRNDTLFADASQYGVPVVLNRYNSDSHESVVRGLELVTDDFCDALGIARRKA